MKRQGNPYHQKTIGLFIGSSEDSYGQALITGALEALKGTGTRLLVFTSGTLKSYHGFEAQRNVLFDLAGPANVEALVMAGSLSHSVPQQELEAFTSRFSPLPLVSLAVQIPGQSCILTDNRPGMVGLMAHLLDFHRYTRLAFIGGPPGQQEAEIRKEVFLKEQEKRGLCPLDSWMETGDYTRESGMAAMERLLEANPGREFQGIVAANDSMAVGAMEVLGLHNLKIPQDHFITGFDDMEESRFLSPPLTTVRQSARLQAFTGVRTALEMLDTGARNVTVDMAAELVVRRSCGCALSRGAEKCPLSPEEEAQAEALRQVLLRNQDNPRVFLEAWKARLNTAEVGSKNSCLSDFLATQLEDGTMSPILYEECMGELVEEIQRREAAVRFQNETRSGILGQSGEALLLSHDMSAVLNVFSESLPRLGFTHGSLVLFADPKRPRGLARLILSQTGHHPVDIPTDGRLFPSEELIPGGLDILPEAIELVVVEAVYSKNEKMGYLVLGTDLAGSNLTGPLRSQLSSALQGVILLEDIRRNQRVMEYRNIELTQALNHLRQAQDQLVQSEKMAALGNLVAGVAHEINTPLGVALTAATFAQAKTKTVSQQLVQGTLKKSELETWISDLLESSNLIETNLHRAAGLVQSFKQIASDQSSEMRRKFKLLNYLNEILLSLAPQWKLRPLKVQACGPEDVEIDSYPGALAQVFTNFLMNSLNHGFEKDSHGTIEVSFTQSGDRIDLIFQDSGQGIPQENLDRIFDPFFTTRRGSGGTGLGLHIVYNLVTGLLGGTIKCESEVGKGTRFLLNFPVQAPDRAAPESP